jgi:molecular chaperone GrpE
MTDKEPTLANKNEAKKDTPGLEGEPRPSDQTGLDDEIEIINPGVSPAEASDEGSEDSTAKSADRQRDASKPKKKPGKAKKVDAKEALNRLMEKNQIITKQDKAITEKDKQLKDLNDKWLRSIAEFENYRKRSRKEWELLKLQSKTEVILEILNVVDDFERAFSAAEDADSSEFVRGIKLIYNNLHQVLEKFGVEEIDAHHVPFDPNFHMAISQVETKDVESGIVAEVIQKGYQLDESVIRPAKVIVAK